ncbi:MAG TPA: cupredoxin domain-containing protein [Pirellulales bacterium]|jgi:plastocyanin|nr:cupredoxin domain-containing protein [Pirellulales bacterium]
MRYLCRSAISAAFSLNCALFCFASNKTDDTKLDSTPITVTMKSMSYEPKRLEIHVGDSVVWTNKAFTTHTATSDDDGKTFDTGEVERGKSSKPVTFATAGEFKYHCTIHGKAMHSTIIVKAVESK